MLSGHPALPAFFDLPAASKTKIFEPPYSEPVYISPPLSQLVGQNKLDWTDGEGYILRVMLAIADIRVYEQMLEEWEQVLHTMHAQMDVWAKGILMLIQSISMDQHDVQWVRTGHIQHGEIRMWDQRKHILVHVVNMLHEKGERRKIALMILRVCMKEHTNFEMIRDVLNIDLVHSEFLKEIIEASEGFDCLLDIFKAFTSRFEVYGDDFEEYLTFLISMRKVTACNQIMVKVIVETLKLVLKTIRSNSPYSIFDKISNFGFTKFLIAMSEYQECEVLSITLDLIKT